MKNTLVINGHPDPESYCYALTESYVEGARTANKTVEVIHIGELEFNLNLKYGYRRRTELETDLLKAQELIKWADHIVWVYPLWWGSYPAIMKGFLDRVLLPGFAFNKREGSVWWDKYLTGKSSRIICTMDQPTWFYRWINKRPSHVAMKKLTLNFIGINKVRITSIGPLRLSTDAFRANWLEKVKALGQRLA